MALAEWQTALQGIDEKSIREAVSHCKVTCEWPPSIAEFLSVCEKKHGLPSEEDTYRFVLRREYPHEMIYEVFEMVGSWAFRNDSEKVLREKVKIAYRECLIKRRLKRLEMK
jgi:hypothetical protein